MTVVRGKSATTRKSRNRPFAKWPFSRFFARFLGNPPRKSFFVDSGQLSSGNTSVEVDTRETLQNEGFRSDVAALYLFEHFGRVIYIYIYTYVVVFDFGVFFPRCVRECSRSCVRKWGAQRPLAGNPYFYSVLWVSKAQRLLQESRQICGVVPGQHADSEASSNRNFGLSPVDPRPGFR